MAFLEIPIYSSCMHQNENMGENKNLLLVKDYSGKVKTIFAFNSVFARGGVEIFLSL